MIIADLRTGSAPVVKASAKYLKETSPLWRLSAKSRSAELLGEPARCLSPLSLPSRVASAADYASGEIGAADPAMADQKQAARTSPARHPAAAVSSLRNDYRAPPTNVRASGAQVLVDFLSDVGLYVVAMRKAAFRSFASVGKRHTLIKCPHMLAVLRFSLTSRCTRRAHAAF